MWPHQMLRAISWTPGTNGPFLKLNKSSQIVSLAVLALFSGSFPWFSRVAILAIQLNKLLAKSCDQWSMVIWRSATSSAGHKFNQLEGWRRIFPKMWKRYPIFFLKHETSHMQCAILKGYSHYKWAMNWYYIWQIYFK